MEDQTPLHMQTTEYMGLQTEESADQTDRMSMDHTGPMEEAMGGISNPMPTSDPDNPQNWPLHRKVYVSFVAFSFAFAVAFGLTSYTIGIGDVVAEFNISMTLAIAPFSLYLVGIAFAPVYTPHVTERFGRAPVYFVSLPICALFLLGSSRAQSIGALAVLRFFAGLGGGPCLVLIEGTFADVWPARTTVTYYSGLTLASYLGAAFGPIILGSIVPSTSWRWTAYVSLMVCLAAYLIGIGAPETYAREIVRTRARRVGRPHDLPPAQSGTTLRRMAQLTVVDPLIMIFTEPIVIMTTLYVSFVFGTTFQWFIAVPAALNLTYGFGIRSSGLAFISAVVGALLAAGTATVIEQFLILLKMRQCKDQEMVQMEIEYRLVPAMVGGVLMTGAFFWVGYTTVPSINHFLPIVGTGIYVWGSMMILISYISYLFDAYPATGTLSALTVAASLRLLVAAVIPLAIIQMITNLGGDWAYGTFGVISAALYPISIVVFKFGARLRMRSRYGGSGSGSDGRDGHGLVMVTLRTHQRVKSTPANGMDSS
ncbi:hypothetical protein Z517_04346 [Fonsecaea pedrosoi CBS 271.37]|uniref:Unplaced genomic scaffold supercont1.3, whole genome shotgun sequence n=1 Tax=Fonsecaea pedrosoi CBS 271.37 TaxID=1442368 RepID=A0A0D2DU56_9EURO|nr:uncharacterized protein Z517_04346 [Fonsecaea pedrosoi CBS 271.37]KIW81321.1 hypothetical protein Z517_04346 [Fonsecaea pedrosoi CBS 271.37]